ncbi:MAG: hypothetical protein RIC03_02615 [Cyclobacteriaceae bacterium]
MSRVIITIIALLSAVIVIAQKDTDFIEGDYKAGFVKLNAQNTYFSSFSLLANEKTERIRLEAIDSLTMNTARYIVLNFYLRQNQYTALSKLFFWSIYKSWTFITFRNPTLP